MLTWLMTAGKFSPRSQRVALSGKQTQESLVSLTSGHIVLRAGSSPSTSCLSRGLTMSTIKPRVQHQKLGSPF